MLRIVFCFIIVLGSVAQGNAKVPDKFMYRGKITFGMNVNKVKNILSELDPNERIVDSGTNERNPYIFTIVYHTRIFESYFLLMYEFYKSKLYKISVVSINTNYSSLKLLSDESDLPAINDSEVEDLYSLVSENVIDKYKLSKLVIQTNIINEDNALSSHYVTYDKYDAYISIIASHSSDKNKSHPAVVIVYGEKGREEEIESDYQRSQRDKF